MTVETWGGRTEGEREGWIARDGVRLRTETWGPSDAPAIVFVHGFPFTRRTWDPQVRALREGGTGWRVITYDSRGLGGSDVGDGQYTMELLVDDLFAVLDGEAGSGGAEGGGGADGADGARRAPVVACGLSMGGYVVLRALEREPERFRGVVLADTRSEPDDDEGRIGRARAIRQLKEGGGALAAWAEGLLEVVLGAMTRGERPELVEAVRRMILSQDVRGMAGCLLAMAGRTDTGGALDGLRVPLLAVAGEEDSLTPPSVARAMAERAPHGRAVTVPGAGHLSNLENPGAFDAALAGFLEGLG